MYNSERARERRENRDRPGTDDAMMGERCKAHAGERCRGAADDLGPPTARAGAHYHPTHLAHLTCTQHAHDTTRTRAAGISVWRGKRWYTCTQAFFLLKRPLWLIT